MRKQRIASGALAFCVTAAMLPTTAQAARLDRYTDIAKNSWYYEAVDYVVGEGYYKGVSSKEFAPDAMMTRAMFVTILSRYDNTALKANESAYVDVPAGTWYTGAVNWAAYNGIVEGKGSGKFDPDGYVTREEMCTIIDRYVKSAGIELKAQSGSVSFKDSSSISSWASGEVQNCVKYGLVTGYPDGTFQPKATVTRAQVAAVIYRLSVLASGGTLEKINTSTGTSAGGGSGSGSGTGGESGKENGIGISTGDLVGLGLDAAVKLADGRLSSDDSASTTLDYTQKSAKTGLIAIDSSVELNENFSAALIEDAAETVCVAVAATTGQELTQAEIKKAITYVVDELGVPASDAQVNTLAKSLSEKTAGLGEEMHQELRNYKGGYPFESIRVEDADGTLLYTAAPASGKTSITRSEIVSTLGKATAAQMKESLRSHIAPAAELDLYAELMLRFDILDDPALTKCTDEVRVECNAALKGDGRVKYYYDEVDCLEMEITSEEQEKYNAQINELIQSVVEEKLKNIDTSIPAGMDIERLLTGENVRALIIGDYEVLYDDIDYAVANMLTVEQVDAAVQDMDLGDITLDEVVDMLTYKTVSTALQNIVKKSMVNAAVAMIHEKVNGTDYEDAVTDNVASYIALTALDGVVKKVNEDAVFFEADAAAAKKTVVNSGELDDLIDQIKKEDQMVEAIEAAEPFGTLMTFDSLRTMPFDELADILREKEVASALDKQDASLMQDVTAYFAALPESTTVTIGDSKISQSEVKALKEADTPKKARLAMIDALDGMDELSLAAFEEGVDVTISYTGGAYTMNMTIHSK